VEFRILGPLEVVEGGQPLALAVGKQRSLLAILLLHANEVVSRDRLIDELWGEHAPASAAKSIQIYVSQLRKALDEGAARLVTRPNGYELEIAPDELDLRRFEDLVEEARRAPPTEAAEKFRAALALWRGPPLADFGYEPFAQAEIARLEELRLTVVEERIAADLAVGRQPDLVGELEGLVGAHPLRERLRGLLMLALYRSGRQAEALQVYQQTRETLVEELGLEPGRELQELEQAILRQDPSLDGPKVARPESRSTVVERISRRPVALLAAGAIVLAAAIASAFIFTRGSGSGGIDHVMANSVGAIDLKSNKIVAQVPVGTRPGPIAYGHGQLWVANLDENTVSRVDPKRRSRTDTVALGAQPTALAVQKRGIWVATDGGIKAIDPAFDDVRAIHVEKLRPKGSLFFEPPTAVAFTPGSAWLVIGNHVTRADPKTGRAVERIPVGNAPSAFAEGPHGLWVTDAFDNTVAHVDPSGVVTATTSVGRSPSSVAAGSDAVWVADADDDDVKRIDPETATVITTVPVGDHPSAVALSPGAVWVANQYDGTIWRIDPRSNKVVEKVKVGGSPVGLAVAAGSLWFSVQESPLVANGSLAKGGGVARVEVPAKDIDPAEENTFTGQAAQWEYATCAKLLNYPDKPAPAGSHLQPELARTLPTLSAGGRTYIFTIRPGYRFSSSQPVTAETMKYTIERSLSPHLQGLAPEYVGDIVGEKGYLAGRTRHIAGVVVRGNTLAITLVHASGSFPVRISMPFFCAVPTNTPIRRTEKPIPSAGPYYIASHQGDQIVLKRNPYYAGPRPHRLREVVYAGTFGLQQSVRRVVAGQADYVPIVDSRPWKGGSGIEDLNARYGVNSPAARRGHQQFFIDPGPEVDGFFLNTTRPLFADARLRRAVNYAIDRRALTRYGGIFWNSGPLSATTTDQYIPPPLPGYREASIYPLAGDLGKARKLAHGRRRRAVLYTCNFTPCPQQAQVVKRDLAAIGIAVEIKTFSAEDLFQRRLPRRGEWDLGLDTWAIDYPDPFDVLNFMFEGRFIGQRQAANYEGFDDPGYNRRLEGAASLSGPQRYVVYARLDANLARHAAPVVAYANENRIDLFSARMGCQLNNPVYGMDLAALCIRQPSRSP
jgi:YVTN family beta-propeller protein